MVGRLDTFGGGAVFVGNNPEIVPGFHGVIHGGTAGFRLFGTGSGAPFDFA